jgi:hypothetical protein
MLRLAMPGGRSNARSVEVGVGRRALAGDTGRMCATGSGPDLESYMVWDNGNVRLCHEYKTPPGCCDDIVR